MSAHSASPSGISELYLLPLPVGGQGLNARIAGLQLQRTDTYGNLLGPAQTVRCALPPHVLPSPAFLMQQKLHPSALKDGLSEYAFYEEVARLLNDPDLVVITWSAHYLESLDALALRTFKPATLLSKVRCVIDLKNLLQVASLCSGTPEKVFPSLEANCKALRLIAPAKDQKAPTRLEMLMRLRRYLSETEGRMSAFAAQPVADRKQSLAKAQQTETPLVLITTTGELKVVLPLRLYGESDVCEALTCQVSMETRVESLDLHQGQMLAPLGILTPERLSGLNLSPDFKEQATKRLREARAQELHGDGQAPTASGTALRLKFFNEQSQADRDYYATLLKTDPRALSRPPLQISKTLRQLAFLFRADNFRGTLISSELELYARLVEQRINVQLPRYVREAQLVAGRVNENDPAELNLIEEILSLK